MLSIESNIARTIDFDAVIRNFIEKAGKAPFKVNKHIKPF